MQITNGIKTGLKYISLFCGIVVVLLGILLCAAKLPQSKIQSNMEASADYLCQGELFGEQIEGIAGTRIDRYADSILLGIAYQYDEDKPMQSVMWSSYYYTDVQNENQNLRDAVYHGYEANQQYMRYWHGSIALVRPLLCFWNIQEIYRINGIILFVLMAVLCTSLAKKKAYILMAGLITGCVMTAVWCVPLSLEYTWTYVLFLLIGLIVWQFACRKWWSQMGYVFMMAGMITAFVDFLTTETLTLLVPLLLALWELHRQSPDKNGREIGWFAGKNMILWGIGYIGMWMMKWGIAAIVLNRNVLPYITSHIEERIGGDIGVNPLSYIGGAITKNLSCLFPFGYGAIGWLVGAGLLFVYVYVAYVYHKKEIALHWIGIYLFIGLLPYFRYVILHNHSYVHYFFTYRAQLATILVALLVLEELTDWRWHGHGYAKRRRA